jgi:hypothetical protein
MSALADFVLKHTVCGSCECGKCVDAPETPVQPTGHTADVYFFQVAAKDNPNIETLRQLLAEHKGEFCSANPLDGEEHDYRELGGWIGDQGLAFRLMGLGTLLGIWKLLTPKNMLPGFPKDLMDRMAGQGYVSIQAKE